MDDLKFQYMLLLIPLKEKIIILSIVIRKDDVTEILIRLSTYKLISFYRVSSYLTI